MAQTPASPHPKLSPLATQVAAALPVAPNAAPLLRINTTISDFLNFKANNALFVDKTALLQDLVKLKRVFLARPRRFGKTILISMLKELFTNGIGQFQHLAIAEHWREDTYPVLHLSFLRMRNLATFEKDLCNKLRDAFFDAGFAEIYDFIPECHEFKVLASRIVRQVLKGRKLVVLIDEWDDPLSSNLHDRTAFKSIAELMSTLYSWLRESTFIKFMLVTGIGRYQDTSFFTGEFITDISLKSKFAALVGYTEEEVRSYFAPYLARSAALWGLSEDAMLDKIRSYYDGFCFDMEGQVHVYSPWSINSFFAQVAEQPDSVPRLMPFWMDNANAPSALRTYLQAYKPDITFIDQSKAEGVELSLYDILSSYNFDTVPFVLLLVQTGYMTIKELLSRDKDVTDLMYRCNFTNAEVENIFSKVILAYVTGQEKAYFDSEIKIQSKALAAALKAHDMARTVQTINSLLVRVHYDLWQSQSREREAVYRVLIALFLQIELSSLYVRQEVANNVGRSDIEALVGDELFVFELKLIPAKTKKKSARSEDSAEVTEAQTEDGTEVKPAKGSMAQTSEVDLDPPSLATQTRIARNAYDQLIGKSYGCASITPVVKRWYGVVLVISEVTRQICYWRYFTTNQELGCGAVEPKSINNPPQFDSES